MKQKFLLMQAGKRVLEQPASQPASHSSIKGLWQMSIKRNKRKESMADAAFLLYPAEPGAREENEAFREGRDSNAEPVTLKR